MVAGSSATRQKIIGRYALYGPLSAGGMASIHFGTLLGPVGFTRTVAVKRLHAMFASDPDVVAMFLDEARLASRIHHPNVCGMHDVVEADGELFLVMDYVPGLSLSALLREAKKANVRMPPGHASAVMIGTLHGLHAAHEARSAKGDSLSIVHRDVSPPNILVGEDGVARVIDFGVAKAAERIHATQDNDLRGKILYMAPEQIERRPVDRRTDVYAAAVVLWESLAGRRYVDVDEASPAGKLAAVLERQPSPPSEHAPDAPRALDEVVMRGLARDPNDRYATAMDMAAAIEKAITPSSQREVGAFVAELAGPVLAERAETLRQIEGETVDVDESLVFSTADASDTAETVVHNPRPSKPTPPLEPVTAPVPAFSPAPAPAPAPALATPATESRARSLGPEPPRSFWQRIDFRPVAIVAVLGAVLVAWQFGARHGRAETAPSNSAAIMITPVSMASATTSPSAAASSPAPEASPGPLESAESVAPAASSAPAISAATTRKTTPPVRPARPSCNPPYTMDNGIKVPKRECL